MTGYAFALAMVAAAILVRAAISPIIGHQLPLHLALPAVILTAVFAGTGPAVLAATTGFTLSATLFWPPDLTPSAKAVIASVYALNVVAVVAVIAKLRSLAGRAHASARLAAAREQEFHSIFELAAVGAARLDLPSGRFVHVNRKLCEMTGYSDAELRGKGMGEMVHPDDRVADQALIRQALADPEFSYANEKRLVRKDGRPIWLHVNAVLAGERLAEECRIVRPDGATRWVCVRAFPVEHAADGGARRTVGIIEDTTEKRQMLDALASAKLEAEAASFCTYCLIPYARGASRSVPADQVLAEVKRLLALGTKELVVTGIHIGDYGRDLPSNEGRAHPIVDLLERVLAEPGLARLRISSLEPAELSDELTALLAAHKGVVCDHMHLPLQSGSDPILKKMRRTYDTRGYADAVERFRAHFPDASIGADVIPGFPGETDEDFAATVRFLTEQKLSYLHVFPYSQRPNTAAARMPGHLPGPVVKERAAELRKLSETLAADYARKFIGRTLPVLWENDVDSHGRRVGHTPNYLSVAAAGGEQPAPGTLGTVAVKGFVEQGKLLARAIH